MGEQRYQGIKRVLPAPLRGLARRARAALRHRGPKSTVYRGQTPGVLGCYVSYNKFGGYCVPQSSAHRGAAQDILAGRVWESGTIDLIRERCGDGDIVHAGMFFGDFLPGLATGCAPGAKVWAFEPNPENFRCAQITGLINGLDNLVVTHAGLGDTPGSIQMRTHDDSGRSLGGLSRLTTDPASTSGRLQEVPVVTIDDTVPGDRRVSILQLDVEGFERHALAGAMRTIERCWPTILLENLPDDEAWFEREILGRGYRIEQVVMGNKVLVHD